MSPVATATRSAPADILKYQSDCVRTQKFIPLGRMQKIAIGPNAAWNPASFAHDPIIRKYGRFIELRDQFLPIGQSLDKSMILITSPLVNRANRVALPDLPDPDWTAPVRTREEIEGIEKKDANGRTYREPYKGEPGRYQAPMIPQNLVDRADSIMEGTQFLVFQPVEYFTFQPEIKGRLTSDAWRVRCKPDFSTSPATHTALLVDRATGEAHFFGGVFDIEGNAGR
jgi:hypothetical protein